MKPRQGWHFVLVIIFASTISFLVTNRLLAQPPSQQNAARPTATTRAPFPPLPPDHQKFVDQVLQIWQQKSQAIERYRADFKRWEYDPVFGPQNTFKTYSEGQVKFAAPDKGLFRVETMKHYQAPKQPGEKPQWVAREGTFGEHWICDGKSIYEHDHKNKQLIQRELPPYMHGRAIADGPLPFLFGADAEKIKQRYWIRALPLPEGVKNEYWLEAFPKTRQDAVNYQKVHVIIDHADFLPKGIVIFDRNFDPVRNPARTTFTFENRETNWNMVLQQVRFWEREFYEPKTPFGWKKVVDKYQAPQDSEQFAPAASAATAGRAGSTPRQR